MTRVNGPTGYELLDCGDGRRLERFGSRVVDRPAPGAEDPRMESPDHWRSADLRFDREGGWSGADRSPWTTEMDGLTLELRPSAGGQVGLYPEHASAWSWLRDAVADRTEAEVLHLFAATGATTLALARSGARVTHVDAARSAVAWARRNAELSGLADRPIRWIVDDATAFVRREARRGRRYDLVVLDPPSWGHGATGERWDLRRCLPDLLDAAAAVAIDDAGVLLTAHTTGLEPVDLEAALADAFGSGSISAEPLAIRARSGAVLSLGLAARMIRG
jgi:23S rRNA (cytosine1962-C5)-methyltransferase